MQQLLIFAMRLLVVFSKETLLYTYLASAQQSLYDYVQKKDAWIE